jgi:hypothetical protein
MRLFAEDCVTYMKVLSNNEVEIFHIDLNSLAELGF